MQPEEIKNLFQRHGGFMTSTQLKENGIYYKRIQSLLDDGIIEKVKRGCYQYVDEFIFSELRIIHNLFPDGILYLESALDYYGYTERTPSSWHLAVDSKSSRTRFYIDSPKIKPHFIRADRLYLGVQSIHADGIQMKIYDKDKTICDCLYHRNKLDAEVFHHAVRSYLSDSDKNLPNLILYAKKLHIESKVREVLGAWI